MPYKNNPTPSSKRAQTVQSKAQAGSLAITGGLTGTINTTGITATTMTPMTTVNSSGQIYYSTGATPVYSTPVPSNWTVVKGPYNIDTMEDTTVHEAPVVGKTTWVASLCVSNRFGKHHWTVFTRLHPDIEFLKCGISDNDLGAVATISNVLFLREEDFLVFEEWFAEYCEVFGGKDNIYSCFLPPPPPIMDYSHQVRLAQHGDLAELSEWIMKSCENRVYMLANILFFLSDDDATLYKLKFTAK